MIEKEVKNILEGMVASARYAPHKDMMLALSEYAQQICQLFEKKCTQCNDATEKAIKVASGHLEAECQQRVEREKLNEQKRTEG
jgi:hypothetical protein